LYAKKEKLFNEGNIANWNLSLKDFKVINPIKILSDKPLAMKLILCKVKTITTHRNPINLKYILRTVLIILTSC